MGAAHRHCEEYSWGEGNMGLDRDIGGDQDKGSRQENQGASELRRTVRYQRHQRDAGNEAENHGARKQSDRSEEHTSELQSLMRISYAVFCLKKKKKTPHT